MTGCSSPCDWASAMAPGRLSTAAMSCATRSPGSSGASPAAVTIQRASGALAADQRMPASTPASGPTKPPMVSGTTGRPKAAKRCGSPLALMTMAPTCGASRQMTWASMGLPASSRSPLSPPPMRRDCPPASSTPVTCRSLLRLLLSGSRFLILRDHLFELSHPDDGSSREYRNGKALSRGSRCTRITPSSSM